MHSVFKDSCSIGYTVKRNTQHDTVATSMVSPAALLGSTRPVLPKQHISRPHGALLYATSPHLNVSRPGRGAARAAATLLSPGGGARGGGGGRAA